MPLCHIITLMKNRTRLIIEKPFVPPALHLILFRHQRYLNMESQLNVKLLLEQTVILILLAAVKHFCLSF